MVFKRRMVLGPALEWERESFSKQAVSSRIHQEQNPHRLDPSWSSTSHR